MSTAEATGRFHEQRRPVAVVPHTHWDREWYEPFQAFRIKLVRLVDELLDLMERDGSFSHFLLDGQMAVIDDYLEVRPENESRLRSLTAAGRIAVGPWYILMDEFLVSGETLIRNLQAGIERGDAFGGAMHVGYLPDMFGHTAQMPQLLALAGLDHAVVWRGVPAAIDGTAFLWTAPDGSRVRTEYLVAGYGNGAALPDDGKALVRRLRTHLEELGPFLGPDDPVLLMNGTDHQRPQPWLGRVVAEANELADGMELTITSLPAYLDGARTLGLPEWRGELRSGARANILMGVASNRVDVKQAAGRAERSIEQLAEPLSALFLPADAWPGPFLELAWRHLIRNSAHDSVCACSADEVVDTVLHRYAEARQIGDALTAESLQALASSMSSPGPVVANPSAVDRGGVVEVVLNAAGEPGPDIQVLSERAGLPGTITLDGTTVKSMLGLIHGAMIDHDTYITGVEMTEDDTGVDVSVVIGTEEREGVPIEQVKRELYTHLSARPETEVRLALDQPPVRRVLARQEQVPGFGWARFAPAHLGHPVRVTDDGGGVTLANGLVTVVIDAADGTFAVDGIPGYGRLVDGGDHGDTYNYSPPQVDSHVQSPVSVTVTVLERGPVRARAEVTSVFGWPERIDDSSRSRVGHLEVPVRTTVELLADEAWVRVRTAFDNPSRDHRLRAHLPLRARASTSRAESAFTIVERGLTAEGSEQETGTPTFPSRRFVSAGGLTVAHEGLLEYELVDVSPPPVGAAPGGGTDDASVGGSGDAAGGTAGALALTLLRATGMLSRLGMTTRPLTAGPMMPLEGAQLLGPVVVRYAIGIGDVDPYRMVEDVFVPLPCTASFGGGSRPERGSVLSVRGAEVSALRRVAGLIEVRVFNPRPTATTVEIPGRTGWLVDLRGGPLAPFEGAFDLRAEGIATVRLDPA